MVMISKRELIIGDSTIAKRRRKGCLV